MHIEAQEVLPRILAELSYDEVILIGHSDGASIAAIYAGTRLTNDDRIRGLILIAPHFFAEEKALLAITEAKIAYEEGELRSRLAHYHGDNVDMAFRGWNDAWLSPRFRHWNIRHLVANIGVPIQVMQGREDQYGTLEQVDVVRAVARASADIRILEGCQHLPHLEQPEVVLESINGFVRSIENIGPISPAPLFSRFSLMAIDSYALPAYPHVPGCSAEPDWDCLEAVKKRAERDHGHNWRRNTAYRYGWYLFLFGYYWEAHEFWEIVWLSRPVNSKEKQLLQGLIQLANARLKCAQNKREASNKMMKQVQYLFCEVYPGLIRGNVSGNHALEAAPVMGLNARDLSILIDADQFSDQS